MSRRYQLGQREQSAAATRARIVAAARAVVAERDPAAFSLEGVAREAKVARTTVYHQFGSKPALLEALFDFLATQGAIGPRLELAFQQPSAVDALDGFVEAFAHFWDSDRIVMRRLQAMATLDLVFAETLRARVERGRHSAWAIVRRLRDAGHDGLGRLGNDAMAADVLHTFTSFTTFDQLAGANDILSVVAPVRTVIHAALGLTNARA